VRGCIYHEIKRLQGDGVGFWSQFLRLLQG